MNTLQVVGHRGAKDLAPENSLAAIQKAINHGVDEIEIDLRVTSDGVVILHHDAVLRLPSGEKITIGQVSLDTLRSYKPDMTKLEDALRLVARSIPVQLEVKPGEPTEPIIKLLTSLLDEGWSAHDFLFGSKSQRTLLALHQAMPNVPTVVIEPFFSVRAHMRARQLDTKRISMNQLGLWSGFIRSMRRRGYQLYAYPLNDPAKAKTWRTAGLAGAITDRPDLFK